jgi:hypothetical protein
VLQLFDTPESSRVRPRLLPIPYLPLPAYPPYLLYLP